MPGAKDFAPGTASLSDQNLSAILADSPCHLHQTAWATPASNASTFSSVARALSPAWIQVSVVVAELAEAERLAAASTG